MSMTYTERAAKAVGGSRKALLDGIAAHRKARAERLEDRHPACQYFGQGYGAFSKAHKPGSKYWLPESAFLEMRKSVSRIEVYEDRASRAKLIPLAKAHLEAAEKAIPSVLADLEKAEAKFTKEHGLPGPRHYSGEHARLTSALDRAKRPFTEAAGPYGPDLHKIASVADVFVSRAPVLIPASPEESEGDWADPESKASPDKLHKATLEASKAEPSKSKAEAKAEVARADRKKGIKTEPENVTVW